jgi:hypothetical protein
VRYGIEATRRDSEQAVDSGLVFEVALYYYLQLK